MIDLFVLGFDPIFLDIIVSPLDEFHNKLDYLPQIGEHVTNTNIKMIPGGNALNVAKVLSAFSSNVFFFCSANKFFLDLIQKRTSNLFCISTSSNDFNITIALQFKTGEVQMNSVSHYFGLSNLSFESLFYLAFSKIIPFSNIGLNKDAIPLFEFFVSYFLDIEKYIEKNPSKTDLVNVFNYISSSKMFLDNAHILKPNFDSFSFKNFAGQKFNLSKKIFYFDPSTIRSFAKWVWLDEFFNDKFAILPGYKVISLNENEFEGMTENSVKFTTYLNKSSKNYLVVHKSTEVSIFQNSIENRKIITVTLLNEEKIITSVGAGDAFNAGLLYELSISYNIVQACENGILTAQKFMTNTL